MVERTDYYGALGVLPTVEPDALAAVYRALVKKYHPDVYVGGQSDAERIIKEINEAYGVLSDPAKRAEYDCARNAPTNPKSRAVARGTGKPWRFVPLRAVLLVGSLIVLGVLGVAVWNETSQPRVQESPNDDSLTTMPIGFLGNWVREPYGCRTRTNAARVSISTTAIAYAGFAPIDVRSVRPVNGNEVVVGVLPEPGPQNESTTGRLRLSGGGRDLVVDWGDGSPEILHRCAE